MVSAPERPGMVQRVEQAYEALRYCQLCPRACAVDRTAGQTGYCGLTHEAHIFREVLHYGEEAELIPSHQVFFSGCNLRCEFCAVAEWNAAPESAPLLDVAQLRECILARRKEGARTLNFLGGHFYGWIVFTPLQAEVGRLRHAEREIKPQQRRGGYPNAKLPARTPPFVPQSDAHIIEHSLP